jgi:HEAT repeat protein
LNKLAERRREAVVGLAVDLGRGGTPTQRRLAFYLLRDLGACGGDAIAAAVEALATEDVSLRLAALAALAAASPGSPDVARIAALVSDPDLRVARAAAAMLGSLGNKGSRVLEALRRARLAADASLRKAASSSLRRLGVDDTVE